MKIFISLLTFAMYCGIVGCSTKVNNPAKERKLQALIVDGQSNHGVWPKTTMMMKDYLEQTDLFEVDIARTSKIWLGPHFNDSIGLDDIHELLTMYPLENNTSVPLDSSVVDPNFSPDFSQYDVIISNFGWMAAHWPEVTKKNFEEYVAKGGGLVVVHAATNSWGDWPEFNKMIGIGGWGGRDEKSGPMVYVDSLGNVQRDNSPGSAGSHGAEHEYVLETQAPEHPIMNGIPAKWMHTQDELYDRFRGPAENITILATAYSDPVKNAPPWRKDVPGTGRQEPLLLTVDYGKGRVFHTGLGHMGYSMECVGFMTTFQRGTEWAATGDVTIPVPADFPSADQVSYRKWGE